MATHTPQDPKDNILRKGGWWGWGWGGAVGSPCYLWKRRLPPDTSELRSSLHLCAGLPTSFHVHHRGVPVLVSHRPFSLNARFFLRIYPQTKPCEDRRLKVGPSHARAPPPIGPPRFHLSALAGLMASRATGVDLQR